MEFYPITAAIKSLDSVPLYVSFLLRFPLPHFRPVVILVSFTLPSHSNQLHLNNSLHSTPLRQNPNLTPTLNILFTLPTFSSPPSNSITACSQHCQDTLAPGCQMDRSHRSLIGRVTIYCVTVFCLLVTDFLILSKPASPINSSNGE